MSIEHSKLRCLLGGQLILKTDLTQNQKNRYPQDVQLSGHILGQTKF